jgi:hypothetical protein
MWSCWLRSAAASEASTASAPLSARLEAVEILAVVGRLFTAIAGANSKAITVTKVTALTAMSLFKCNIQDFERGSASLQATQQIINAAYVQR